MGLLSKRDAATSLCEGVAAGILDPTGFGLAAAGIKFFAALLPGPTFEKQIKRLQKEVAAVLPKGVEYEPYEVDTAQTLIVQHLPRARELFERKENPVAITGFMMKRGAALLDGFEDEPTGRVRTMVQCFVHTYLEMAEVRQAIEHAARQNTRRRLEQLTQQQDRQAELGQQLHDLFARWVETDILYDPRTDLRRVAAPNQLPQPSVLLDSKYEVVPFQGRREALRDLDAFRNSDGDFGTLMLAGDGGLGKTRLMMEAVTLALRDNWRAGFLRRDIDLETLRRGLGALTTSPKPLFLIIDYAEDRPDQVATVLAEWIEEQPRKRRVVLLTRHEALVGQALEAQGSLDDRRRTAADYLKSGLAIPLIPQRLYLSPEGRRDAFIAAQEAFKALPGVDPDEVYPVDKLQDTFFERSHFARPLYLHMAALASLTGKPTARKEALLEAALKREGAYLTRVLDDVSELNRIIKGEQLHETLALATLAMAARPATDEAPPTAEAFLAATSLGEALDGEQRRVLGRLLTELYPPPEPLDSTKGMDALRPDPLGEGLVYATLNDRPELAQVALSEGQDEASLASACTVLIRTALALAEDGRDGAPEWLLRHLADDLSTRARLINLLYAAIHPQSTALAVFATSLMQRQVAFAKQVLNDAPDDPNRQDFYASIVGELGNRLSNLGLRKEALAAAEEAVATYRNLAKHNSNVFLPKLANSLHNLGAMHSKLGRSVEALAATEESVAIQRNLVGRDPDLFLPDLAASLNSLGFRLWELEENEKALTATEEAVAIYRELAENDADTFLSDLATSLNNISVDLGNLGQQARALVAAEEATELYRALAERNPDAFLPNLAVSLNTLSNRLLDSGKHEEALVTTEEAIVIRRRLAERNHSAFSPELVTSLGTRGLIFLAVQSPMKAMTSFTEAIQRLTPFFSQMPQAFAPTILKLCRDYVTACEATGEQPDEALLAPVVAVLEQVQGDDDG